VAPRGSSSPNSLQKTEPETWFCAQRKLKIVSVEAGSTPVHQENCPDAASELDWTAWNGPLHLG
jgi:hypothetical protein